MSKERPFEDITPVQNIKVGYFEKEEYLRVINRQEKQIESYAYQILALQSRIEILEKSQRLQGEYSRGFIDALDKAFSKFDANCVYSGDRVLQKLEKLKEEVKIKGGAEE